MISVYKSSSLISGFAIEIEKKVVYINPAYDEGPVGPKDGEIILLINPPELDSEKDKKESMDKPLLYYGYGLEGHARDNAEVYATRSIRNFLLEQIEIAEGKRVSEFKMSKDSRNFFCSVSQRVYKMPMGEITTVGGMDVSSLMLEESSGSGQYGIEGIELNTGHTYAIYLSFKALSKIKNFTPVFPIQALLLDEISLKELINLPAYFPILDLMNPEIIITGSIESWTRPGARDQNIKKSVEKFLERYRVEQLEGKNRIALE